MLEVAHIFRQYGQAYLDAFGDRMPPRHRVAMQDILDCRTERLGGQVFVCEACGGAHYAYHSCFNRSCPKCHSSHSEAWIQDRQAELLGVPYFHLVFTLPHELHEATRSHQAKIYGILMQAAAKSLLKLARDPRFVGGSLGILCVLHTWSRTLDYHPHVHCLVPAGGVSQDHRWLPAKKSFLVPVRALSKIFKAIFRDQLEALLPSVSIPTRIWKKRWNVFCKSAVQGSDTVLSYLARYVHRVAIANSRILDISKGHVTFTYQDSSSNRWHTMTLQANEFIRRFLQHVLPKGFHKIRYYGFWAPPARQILHRLQLILSVSYSTHQQAQDTNPTPELSPSLDSTLLLPKCPYCHEPALILLQILPRPKRAPPTNLYINSHHP